MQYKAKRLRPIRSDEVRVLDTEPRICVRIALLLNSPITGPLYATT